MKLQKKYLAGVAAVLLLGLAGYRVFHNADPDADSQAPEKPEPGPGGARQ